MTALHGRLHGPEQRRFRAAVTVLALVLAGCPAPPAGAPAVSRADGGEGLKELAGFPIGVAVPIDPRPNSLLGSAERQAVVNRHFDSLTAENGMKMAYLQPRRAEFTFEHADALVAYAGAHGMIVHGHVLVWHKQAPDWMNRLSGPRQEFARVLREHVTAVARHFAGRVASWDVVNEAFTDDTPVQYRDTIWYRHLGADYLALAFTAAHAAAPDADLYYNDYDISGALGPEKLERILVMADEFRARHVPLDGIGFQMHVDTRTPGVEQIRDAFSRVVQRGLKVRISELDVSVNQDERLATLDPATAELQRHRYAEIVRAYVETVPPALRGGITVWGIGDADSWIPGFRDRDDWPLLFDGELAPKPALQGFAEGLAAASTQCD